MSKLAKIIFVWEYCGGFELNHMNSFFFLHYIFFQKSKWRDSQAGWKRCYWLIRMRNSQPQEDILDLCLLIHNFLHTCEGKSVDFALSYILQETRLPFTKWESSFKIVGLNFNSQKMFPWKMSRIKNWKHYPQPPSPIFSNFTDTSQRSSKLVKAWISQLNYQVNQMYQSNK